MPIISKVEARTFKGKFLQGLIALVLTLGGITMMYPFVVMLAGSLRSEMDAADLDVIPAYFLDDRVLLGKFLETKYNQNTAMLNAAHLHSYFSFQGVRIPEGDAKGIAQRANDFRAFQAEVKLPRHWQNLGGVEARKTIPENLRVLRTRVRRKFNGDIDAFGQSMGTASASWLTLVLPTPKWESRRFDDQNNVLYETYFEMLEESEPAERQIISLSGSFLEAMIHPVYGQTGLDAYNQAHTVKLKSFDDFRLPQTVPGTDQPRLRAEWIEYTGQELNVSFVLTRNVPNERFQQYLEAQYKTIDQLNSTWHTKFTGFDQIELPTGQWLKGPQRQDYREFLNTLEPENLILAGPEFAYRQWLQARYGTIEKVNEAQGTTFASFDEIPMPVAEMEYRYVADNSGSLRLTYALRNYINVFDELAGEGRVLVNTLFFCILAIVLALLVNPLAAYAMSRFKLPGTYKILLLLMATMAFPPMVTLIPQFIILRNLDLLNTFAALVIPLVANGYMVFLLKGFFDSLPSELYEAARIDGASELRMFFQITLALSQPVLAVLALMVFNSAYTMFLYALLVAPNQDMWLISVWLYQFQTRSNMGGVFAAVVVSSIPTLLIFLFAQRVIMRGIVVPTEK